MPTLPSVPTMPSKGPVAVVGLGNMGSELAVNLLESGFDVVGFDLAGPSRSPDGATFAASVADVARRAPVVVCSLPDAAASLDVARAIVAVPARLATHVVDTSTIGVEAAEEIAALLGGAGVGYVDAPVSGGPAGARARTLAVMYAAPGDACAYVDPVLAGLSDVRHRVGDRAGLGQAMKLANNFLSATALAATSEAVAFGRSVGLDPATMLAVFNAASGRNTATSDKFPNHVVTGRFASGFSNTLMHKDVRLYLRSVEARHGPDALAAVTASVWARFAAEEAGADFTRIAPFVDGASRYPERDESRP
jgi:3-hydroxyisobutyrate dehydrogenase-like beta-hydroxyacid dehydrogenase